MEAVRIYRSHNDTKSALPFFPRYPSDSSERWLSDSEIASRMVGVFGAIAGIYALTSLALALALIISGVPSLSSYPSGRLTLSIPAFGSYTTLDPPPPVAPL